MELVLTGKKIEFSPSCAEVVNDTSYIEDYNTFLLKFLIILLLFLLNLLIILVLINFVLRLLTKQHRNKFRLIQSPVLQFWAKQKF